MPSHNWKLRAQGGGLPMVADAAEVRRAIALFADPTNDVELISLRSGVHRTLAGADLDGLVKAAGELPTGAGLYFRVNPVVPGLADPAKNGDIVRRRWVYVDVDPVKAAGSEDDPATDDEKERTSRVCQALVERLGEAGWPTPVVVDSGNGYGVFYRCDLPNDKVTAALLRSLLAKLSDELSGPDGRIDRSVHNANRLAKLPGTWARKGRASDDRPHRVCKILTVPPDLGIVGPELLARTVGTDGDRAPEPSRPATGEWTGSARRFLQAELARLALARTGDRNNALNKSSFTLGGLVGQGLLSREEVEAALIEAGRGLGLDDDPGCGEKGIRSTVRSGLDAGKAQPWEPVAPGGGPRPAFSANGKPPEPMEPGERLTVSLANIDPLPVDWLVRNRIAKRFITVMAGRTGIGKSFVMLDLIARISRGQEIPFSGGRRFDPAGTLIISEDSHEYVLAPRLINAGADMRRIHAMTWKAMSNFSLSKTEMLTQAANEIPGGMTVLMIDPPTNFLRGADGHKDDDIRQLVMFVVEWALARDVAILFILHVNKQAKGVEALNRVMGSVAWVTTSRVAHAFCKDPNDPERCLWVPMKNNLGPMEKAIAYRIEDEGGAAKVQWLAEIDVSADEAMNAAPPKERRDVAAADWLIKRFREQPEWDSDELFKAAKAQGVSRNAIFEAKKVLAAAVRRADGGEDRNPFPRARKVTKENGDVAWHWYVTPEWLACYDEATGKKAG